MLVNLGRLIVFALIFGMAFYLGFAFATREIISSKPATANITATNGFIENTLTKIQSRPIFGINNSQRQSYGELLFKVNGSQTEFLIKLNSIPINSVRPSDKKEQVTPNSLNLQVARICCGGLDYNYENTGFIVNLETRDNQKSGNFSGIFKFDLEKDNVDRLLLVAEPTSLFRVIKEDTKDWPSAVTEKPAPYFWVNL